VRVVECASVRRACTTSTPHVSLLACRRLELSRWRATFGRQRRCRFPVST
jgi:hypothetical protein